MASSIEKNFKCLKTTDMLSCNKIHRSPELADETKRAFSSSIKAVISFFVEMRRIIRRKICQVTLFTILLEPLSSLLRKHIASKIFNFETDPGIRVL